MNKCLWYNVICNMPHLVFLNLLIYLHLQDTKNEYFHANENDCYIYATPGIWNKSGRDDTGGYTFICINIWRNLII